MDALNLTVRVGCNLADETTLPTPVLFVLKPRLKGRVLVMPEAKLRAFIEAVPTDPSTQKPAQAEITVAESLAEGAVELEFDATHATGFQVWLKAPGEAQFVLVGDLNRPGSFSAIGLTAGNYEYQVVGANARGEGPASATANVSAVAVRGTSDRCQTVANCCWVGRRATVRTLIYSVGVEFRKKWSGAGGGNRTRVASLEDWNSTIELRPRLRTDYIEHSCLVNSRPCRLRPA